ncbi:MAG: alpha/beta fold hydrolase [Candidatus Micrarchaeota archaeon]|nr:alpha/beta fold hydrolase [Candidatus Micrarchaeota archaeon]
MQKSVEIKTASKQLLRGTLFQRDEALGKTPAVLFVHGWKSGERNYASRAEAVAALGYTCLTFDLRGHGRSDGNRESLTIADSLDDAVAAFYFLAGQPEVDAMRMHVVGTSYGGYLSAALLSECHVESLVLRSPALYVDGDFHLTRDQRKERAGKIEVYNRAMVPMAGFRGKTLIIESEHDETIPHSVIQRYFDAARFPTHKVIDGADHNLREEAWRSQFIGILREWFGKLNSFGGQEGLPRI